MRHRLTGPYSPTTTGKIERLHKTMRAEFFTQTAAATIDDLQATLDAWVDHYNTERPYQGIATSRRRSASPSPNRLRQPRSSTRLLPEDLSRIVRSERESVLNRQTTMSTRNSTPMIGPRGTLDQQGSPKMMAKPLSLRPDQTDPLPTVVTHRHTCEAIAAPHDRVPVG